MFRCLLFFLLFVSLGFAEQKNDHIRILKLLPYVVEPPLVDPFLPANFTLGEKEDDPYFTAGYYWGTAGNLSDYFKDPSTLKGCLIRSQLAKEVAQTGGDRFSNDGDLNKLRAAGFTEIKVNRGKWGIFPYRELLAKGPRGRKYYQMWVGLNTEEGATLYFQFIYPEYLKEPTHHQKQIWDHFVRRTTLLKIDDLLVAKGRGTHTDVPKLQIVAQKRRFDQKLFIHVQSPHVEIDHIEDLLHFVKVQVQMGKEMTQTLQLPCEMVDHFSFSSEMLSLDRFKENKHYLLFQ